MRCKLIVRVCIAALFQLTPFSVAAQGMPTAAVYRDQFVDMADKIDGVLRKARAASHPQSSGRERLALREEVFALQELVHRLEAEASRSNVDGLRLGRDSSKKLLLVAQGCAVLKVVTTAGDNYLDTDDQIFLAVAVDANASVMTLRKLV